MKLDLQITTLDVSVYPNKSENSLFYEIIIGNIVKGDKGDSAYQVWLDNGHTGTIDDFFDWIKQPATDAAAELFNLVGIYNVTALQPLGSGYYNLTTALAAVPVDVRKIGLFITFESSANSWELYQFKGTSILTWDTISDWVASVFQSTGQSTLYPMSQKATTDGLDNKINKDGSNSLIDVLRFKNDTLQALSNIGDIRFSQESQTLEVKISSTCTIQIGEEMTARVKNGEASTILNGKVVYIDGAVGSNPIIKLASTADADIAAKTFAVATEDISTIGRVTTEGLVRDIDTSAFAEGSLLWLSTAGGLSTTEPTSPTPKICIGVCLRQHSVNGVIYVKIRSVGRLQKLSDVYAPTITGGDVLKFNATNGRFEPFALDTALGTKLDKSAVKQTTGTSLTDTISQDGITKIVEQVKNDINGIKFDVSGAYINKTTGNVSYSASYKCTEFEYFGLIKDIYVTGYDGALDGGNAALAYFYNADKQPIWRYTTGVYGVKTLQKISKEEILANAPTAVYVRASAQISQSNAIIQYATLKTVYDDLKDVDTRFLNKIVQTTGTSTNTVISQDGVTKSIEQVKKETNGISFSNSGYIHKDTGMAVVSTLYMNTPFIYFGPAKDITITAYKTGNACPAYFYDKDMTPLWAYLPSIEGELNDHVITKDQIELNAPTAVYIRCTARTYQTKAKISFASFNVIYNDLAKIFGKGDVIISGDGVYQNNLLNQSDTINLISGSYAGEDSVYKIDFDTNICRTSFDFKINANVNINNDDTTMCDIVFDDDTTTQIKLLKSACTSLFRLGLSGNDLSQLQSPKYNSGFKVGEISLVRDSQYTEAIVGQDVFCIWLKGAEKITTDFIGDNKITGEQFLSAREAWLSANRDTCVVIENDTFSIIQDGLDVTESRPIFNQTRYDNNVVIFSTSLKDEFGVWKSVITLYTELVSANVVGGALENFYLNFYDLTEEKNCGDILQFGKMGLVGNYYQQITNVDTDYGVPQAYHYDSFPFMVKLWKDESTHNCEIIRVNSNLYISIDGQMVASMSDRIKNLYIGGDSSGLNGGIKPFNLEIYSGSIGDAEIITTSPMEYPTIISKRNPYIIGVMGHGIVDTWKDSGVTIPSTDQTSVKMEDVCLDLKKKGYVVLSFDDLVKVIANRSFPSKRMAIIVFDDLRVDGIYVNKRIRSFLSKFGFTGNFAAISDRYPQVQENFNLFTSMRSNNWGISSHSLWHNVQYNQKNSVVLFAELNKIQEISDIQNFSNNVLTYPFAPSWENTHTLFKMTGFAFAIHNNAPYAWMNFRNRYTIGRISMSRATLNSTTMAFI